MTLTEFKPLLEKQQKSSLSMKEFCECYDIAYSTFTYWKRKFLNDSPQNETFIEIATSSNSSHLLPHTSIIEITTPNGYTIKLPNHNISLTSILNTIG